MNELEAQGIQFVSLTENMEAKTPTGRLEFQIFGALAEYERGLNRERALAAAAARARGRQEGRTRVMTEDKAPDRPNLDAGSVALLCPHLADGECQRHYSLSLFDPVQGAALGGVNVGVGLSARALAV